MILSPKSLIACVVALCAAAPAAAQLLGTASTFGVLAGQTITNTGPTVVTGNLGISPGSSITGFPPGVVIGGTIHAGDAVALQAQNDLTTAYNTLAGLAPTYNLSGSDLGGMTLTSGVYKFDSSAQLTGQLTLDIQNDPHAHFIFQIGSTLTTATDSMVTFINPAISADCCDDDGVFWQVGSSATLGTDTDFAGNIVALTSITLNTGASIDYGRALARNGSVTLDTNTIGAFNLMEIMCISLPTEFTPVPEASTYGVAGSVVLLFAAWRRRKSARNRSVARA